MDYKRGAGIAVLLYLASFAVGIVASLIVGTTFPTEETIPTTHWVLTIILSVVLAVLFSRWYFKGKKISASPKEGMILGLLFLGVGIIGDLLFLLPYLLFGTEGAEGILAYYQDPWFYVSVVLVILTPVVIGALRAKK